MSALLRELAWTVTNDDHRDTIRWQLGRLRATIASAGSLAMLIFTPSAWSA